MMLLLILPDHHIFTSAGGKYLFLQSQQSVRKTVLPFFRNAKKQFGRIFPNPPPPPVKILSPYPFYG